MDPQGQPCFCFRHGCPLCFALVGRGNEHEQLQPAEPSEESCYCGGLTCEICREKYRRPQLEVECPGTGSSPALGPSTWDAQLLKAS